MPGKKKGNSGTWFLGNFDIWREFFTSRNTLRNGGKLSNIGGKLLLVPGKMRFFSQPCSFVGSMFQREVVTRFYMQFFNKSNVESKSRAQSGNWFTVSGCPMGLPLEKHLSRPGFAYTCVWCSAPDFTLSRDVICIQLHVNKVIQANAHCSHHLVGDVILSGSVVRQINVCGVSPHM